MGIRKDIQNEVRAIQKEIKGYVEELEVIRKSVYKFGNTIEREKELIKLIQQATERILVAKAKIR